MAKTELPPTYNKYPHPVIRQDKDCSLCQLGKDRQRRNYEKDLERQEGKRNVKPNNYCVGGAGPDDLSHVKLIVISDYPGYYESQEDVLYPMYESASLESRNRKGLLESQNAGACLRNILRHKFNLDTYNDCWFTNAVRCDPTHTEVLEAKHLKPCIYKWLVNDLVEIDKVIPTVPILLAGKHAFRAFRIMYNWTDRSQNNYRRKVTYAGRHPVVVTINPAGPAKSMAKIESEVSMRGNTIIVTRNEWLSPLVGSPIWHFVEDLKLLKEFF